MDLEIRQAKKEDLGQILALLTELSETKVDQVKAQPVFEEILKSGYYFPFVAIFNNKVVGTASLLIGPSLQHGKSWGLIDNVAVVKDCQGMGIGRKLIGFLVDFAKKKDCYKIILTARFARSGAHKFWEKLGFEKHGFSFRMDL